MSDIKKILETLSANRFILHIPMCKIDRMSQKFIRDMYLGNIHYGMTYDENKYRGLSDAWFRAVLSPEEILWLMGRRKLTSFSDMYKMNTIVGKIKEAPKKLLALKLLQFANANNNGVVYAPHPRGFKSWLWVDEFLNSIIREKYMISKLGDDLENTSHASVYDVIHWNQEYIYKCLEYSFEHVVTIDSMKVLVPPPIQKVRHELGIDYTSDIKLTKHLDPSVGEVHVCIDVKDLTNIEKLCFEMLPRFRDEVAKPVDWTEFEKTANDWLNKKNR